MDSTLTDVEKTVLAEEEEKRKKAFAKEMENAVAYYLMIKYGKIELKKNIEFQKALVDGIFSGLTPKEKMDFSKTFPNMAFSYEAANRSVAMMHSFFSCDLSLPENKELKENMEALEINEDQFATLAFCACGDDMERFIKNFDKQVREDMIKEAGGSAEAPEKDDEAELEKIRDTGILSAKDAISKYKNGDPKLYAKILGDALLIACTGFAKEHSDDVAMQWSIYTDEILNQFRARRELIRHCRLTERHFEFAEKVASMGHTMKRGLRLSEKLGAVTMSDKMVSENGVVKELNLEIIKFKTIANSRGRMVEELYKIQFQPKVQEKVLG